jgi:hypothetical protein
MNTTAQANQATFAKLMQNYIELNPVTYPFLSASRTPQTYAVQFTTSLASGGADKEGTAVKHACKVLGLKHAYKAITAFLNATNEE